MPTCPRARTSARSARRASSAPRRSSITGIRRPAGSTSKAPLRPRAFDLNKLARRATPARGRPRRCCAMRIVQMRFWQLDRRRWIDLARNRDGDELLFVHAGRGRAVSATTAISSYRDGDYVVIPRGTMWRLDAAAADRRAADRGDQRQLHAAGEGPASAATRSSIRRCSTRRAIDDAFRAQQSDERAWQVSVKRRNAISTVTYPFNPLDAVGLARRLSRRCASTGATSGRSMSHRYHLPPSAHTTFVGQPLRGLHVRAAAVRDRSRARSRCRSSTTTTTTTR